MEGVDAQAAQRAPFYYLHLRRHARGVVSVPWEAGSIHDGARHTPIFLFSPGRCGSTLLSRILSAAGMPNVSEPDFYTQLTTTAMASGLNPFRSMVVRAAADMGSDLAAALDAVQPPVVKLRAEVLPQSGAATSTVRAAHDLHDARLRGMGALYGPGVSQ